MRACFLRWIMASMIILLAMQTAMAEDYPALHRVDALDLTRYQGLWYEIARLPNSFQDHCVADVTASYTLLDSGKVEVINACREEDGSIDSSTGLARRPDPNVAARLEVRFAPRWLSWLPFVWGEYHVIGLGDDYDWALVGEPSRKYLWILARTQGIHKMLYQEILRQAQVQGFAIEQVQKTIQGAE